MPDSDEDVSSFMTLQYCFHCSGVITIGTEFSGIRRRVAAISAIRSLVALSVVVGASYVPSSTTLAALVFAWYPKSSNSSPLQMGASPASVYCFLCTSEKIVFSTVSCVVCSIMIPPFPSTWIDVALLVLFFPVTKFNFRQKFCWCSRCMMELIF